jgi:hypothetical protein
MSASNPLDTPQQEFTVSRLLDPGTVNVLRGMRDETA